MMTFGVRPRGRPVPPTPLPVWFAGLEVNQYVQILGTTLMGSPAAPTDTGGASSRSNRRLSFSNLATDDNNQIILACTGGHFDSDDNSVTAIDMKADVPTWRLLKPWYEPSIEDVDYYSTSPVVEPTSRHTYNSVQWSSTRQRLVLHASPVRYGPANSSLVTNGFNLETGLFDPVGTFALGRQALCRDQHDFVWTRWGTSGNYPILCKWDPATDTWTNTGSFSQQVTKQLSWDTLRSQLFQLTWGDGGSGGTERSCYVYRAGGTTQTAITLNPVGPNGPNGNAVEQFDYDATHRWPDSEGNLVGGGADCCLEYDSLTDRFYWSDGLTGRLYYAVPNEGNTWDFGILQTTGTLAPRSYSHARMKIFKFGTRSVAVFMPAGYRNLYALRLS